MAVARLAAVAPICPLAWELPFAAGADLKSKERKEKERQTDRQTELVKKQKAEQWLPGSESYGA